MIRINLLPQKRRVEASEGRSQVWLGVILAAVLVQVVALFVFHSIKTAELDEQKRKNQELSSQIDRSKAAVKDHAQVKEKLATLRAREDAIAKLQSARTGPTAVLLEVARILTTGRGPTVEPDKLTLLRRENPMAVHNERWDARRLWLTRFVEQARSVRLEGVARDGEDVSELARRLGLSPFFTDVRLLPAKKEKDKSGLALIKFQLEAKVRY